MDFRGATGEFFSVYANAVVKTGRPFTAQEMYTANRFVNCVVPRDQLAPVAELPLAQGINFDL